MQLFIISIWLVLIKELLKLQSLTQQEIDMHTQSVEVLRVSSIIHETQQAHGMYNHSTKTGLPLMLLSLPIQV